RRPSHEETALLLDISNSVGLAVHQDRIAQQLARSIRFALGLLAITTPSRDTTRIPSLRLLTTSR
ncbi:hypothetical protein, partial [Burkholderia multivorans]|uniref:hypothetical protein n=1 Tax=Burkholderia multivorans TaxID=87883 RepID=UPI0015ECB051